MSELDDAIDTLELRSKGPAIGIAQRSRAELAQLRADLQAAQERSAMQAQQLEAVQKLRELAEELVNSLGYWMSAEEEPQECLKAELALGEWLAANPAPEEQT